jgi:hypothetical protein
MSILESAGMALLRRFDPETAHGLALKALQLGLAPLPAPVRSRKLQVRLAGLDLPNPVGLAAGFDKNAPRWLGWHAWALALSRWAQPHPARKRATPPAPVSPDGRSRGYQPFRV